MAAIKIDSKISKYRVLKPGGETPAPAAAPTVAELPTSHGGKVRAQVEPIFLVLHSGYNGWYVEPLLHMN